MRVRYEMAGASTYEAECDLSEKQARKRFAELGANGLCKWAELVDEDEHYMDVIDSFDHTNTANAIYDTMKLLGL